MNNIFKEYKKSKELEIEYVDKLETKLLVETMEFIIEPKTRDEYNRAKEVREARKEVEEEWR